MPDRPHKVVHISSVVVRCRRGDMARLQSEINTLDGAEIAHGDEGKLIVILEGPTSGTVGELLTRISLLDGVVSAAMVYEQIEPIESLGEEA